MIRGSMLELMDHTFDGHEDSLTGDLRGGLGQLVDGKYGRGNFKAAGMNGQGKGSKHEDSRWHSKEDRMFFIQRFSLFFRVRLGGLEKTSLGLCELSVHF